MMNMPEFQLNKQIFLITGAAGYLGAEISLGVASMGGIPLLCGRNLSKLEALAEKIQAAGKETYIINKAIDSVDDCQLIMHQLGEQFGKLDGIVNCAHDGRAGTIESSMASDFELAQKIQVQVPFFLVQSGLELLKETAKNKASGISIVNIASMYGLVSPNPEIYGVSGNNNPPYYGAAKAGLLQLTRYMASHLGPYNIRVNSVSPGPFPPESIKELQPDFYKNLCTKNPLGRIGSAPELVGPVIFLLSAASSFVTGANLAVDGGWTSW